MVFLFPEGTREKDGAALPFKAGGLKLATKSGVTVVPVTLEGVHKVLEGSHYRVTQTDINVTFHPPIRTRELDADGLKELPDRVEKIIKGEIIL